MLTLLTQKAIAALHDIDRHGNALLANYNSSPEEVAVLCAFFERKGLVTRLPGTAIDRLESYRLTRPLADITLLDVLEATGEHLNCNHPTTEEFYARYGGMARRLGVVNQMTRFYLQGIKLTEC